MFVGTGSGDTFCGGEKYDLKNQTLFQVQNYDALVFPILTVNIMFMDNQGKFLFPSSG